MDEVWIYSLVTIVGLVLAAYLWVWLGRRQERELAALTSPPPIMWRIRSALLGAEIESAQEIEWLLNVYRWNGRKVPPREHMPAYILDAYAKHEERKAYFAEQMDELEKMRK